MSGKPSWEVDSQTYPVQQGECRLCHTIGQVKLAWDQRGSLCRDMKVCMRRWSKAQEQTGTEEG